ncbi:putative aminohydrolase SsnA [Anaerococcus porci]|uniref:Putative aminohydrolase SsnA n=1 Tax=Anaerococcus porci TaxID=2652269 RepID=A0A6N7VST4_9FIRM|nr:putative aminohydrolase SsnA [Anaerococcus porci]MDY3005703.1 putative aminohydrolase SsnA [Anaerococcus porci]MSS77926.1 putative aminohydrolase SsnA [Anaerococcus porci]
MIIKNCLIITNDENNSFYENGAVYIKDKLIEDVGNSSDIVNKYEDEEVIDFEGKLLMPGMICAHSHIYSAYARGMGVSKPTDNFFNVLENQWWALDRQLTTEDVRLNALTTYMESIANGVTTVIDHHSGPNSVENSLFTLGEAAKEVGIRTNLCYELSDRDGKEIRDKEIKENIDWIKHCQKEDDDMLRGLFGLHASFTLSDESLEKAVKAMDGVYDGYHVHIAEGIEDQWDCQRKYGKRIVERLEDFGIITENTLAIHCVHINGREMDILKEHNTPVIFNPESNMNNAVGVPPVNRFIEKGLKVGLGTDAYTNDMFESMKVANIIQAHNTQDPTKGFAETLDMQFKNNPEIVSHFLNHEVGRIKKGAYADLISFKYDPYTPLNENNWGGHSLFGLTGRLVNDTIINGEFVMRDKIITKVDQAKIHADSRQRAEKIWSKL